MREEEYAALIEREADYWDREFVVKETGYKCFIHHCPWINRRFTRRYLELIVGRVTREMAVLDLGCGIGWLSLMLAPHVREVLGLDIAKKCIDHAATLAAGMGQDNCRFEVFDANREDLPENRFDMIVTWGALHHIADLDHAIENIGRALKRDGVLIVFECEDIQGARGALGNALADLFHLVLPTDRSYGEKLRYGFKRLFRNEQELEWSPFEMHGGAHWRRKVLERFSLEFAEGHFGLIPNFIARLGESKLTEKILVPALFLLDEALVKLHVLKPQYHFMILGKHQ